MLLNALFLANNGSSISITHPPLCLLLCTPTDAWGTKRCQSFSGKCSNIHELTSLGLEKKGVGKGRGEAARERGKIKRQEPRPGLKAEWECLLSAQSGIGLQHSWKEEGNRHGPYSCEIQSKGTTDSDQLFSLFWSIERPNPKWWGVLSDAAASSWQLSSPLFFDFHYLNGISLPKNQGNGHWRTKSSHAVVLLMVALTYCLLTLVNWNTVFIPGKDQG